MPLFVLLLLASCASSDESGDIDQEVTLLFGYYKGLVPGGDLSDIYLLNSSNLYLDSLGNYPSNGFYEGEYTEMDNSDFQIAQDLISFFPSELFDEFENYVGCPDCADQGGIYVEYERGDQHSFWNIDNQKDALPEYLHEFVDKISEKVILLNN